MTFIHAMNKYNLTSNGKAIIGNRGEILTIGGGESLATSHPPLVTAPVPAPIM